MPPPRWLHAISALFLLALTVPAGAETLKAVYRFTDTGKKVPSHYAFGASPRAELLQASDGNFYGTTSTGGTGACPDRPYSTVIGCGTIFRMTPQGAVTVIYSFPYDTDTGIAANGAFPTAGLIQGVDGNLYGVAQDGGPNGNGYGCNGALGCGTLFRISLSGTFTLLHQFCGIASCPNIVEGGRPMAHLVQRADTSLCGTTAQGGYENEGTVFCASTNGNLNTLYMFEYENGTDGYDPLGALLVGADGTTLYGTTASGGVNGGSAGGGTVFALKGSQMTILHAFDNAESGAAGTYYTPEGALILGANGKFYSTTAAGGDGGGCIFSLETDGTGFKVEYDFDTNASSNAPGDPAAGLVLAKDGMMYGTTMFGSIEQTYGLDNGIVFSFNPARSKFKPLADFNTSTGYPPTAALIEGADKYLYGTALGYGGSNKHGTDAGSVVRLSPPLKK